MVSRVRHQVRIADAVILNKTDLQQDDLDAIEKEVRTLNPFAAIHHASYCDVPVHDIITTTADTNIPVALRRKQEHEGEKSAGRPDVFTGALRTTRKISRDALQAFLDSVAPQTYRLKGYVVRDDDSVVAVQSVFGKTDIRKIDTYVGPTELVFIARELTPEMFEKAFRHQAG
jgi:G3E family GTPase